MPLPAGIFFHAVGASSASLCYTPQKKTERWSWQTFWMLQALFCWLLLPLLVAYLTVPQLGEVLSEAPKNAMWNAFLLGAAYGIGGTAFGIAIRYVGFSLTYAIAVGLSCVLGTLIPPMVHGQMGEILSKTGAGWVMSGIGMGALGIALCGLAGRFKEKDIARDGEASSFNLAIGLPLCLLAGVLSAVYGFALDAGVPIAEVAAKHGAGLFQGNVIYIFANSGAFVTTLIYCLYLHLKHGTLGEYRQLPGAGGNSQLPLYFAMAALTGLLWYGQFFFYGLGHQNMGSYKFSSWAIHMIMLVLFSSVAGLVLKEWLHTSGKTRRTLIVALSILLAAVIVLTYGNHLGGANG